VSAWFSRAGAEQGQSNSQCELNVFNPYDWVIGDTQNVLG
jgi:hypothetical protein